MSDFGERMSEELDGLRALRDEMRVKAHLGAAEAREAWEGLERKWGHLEGKLKLLAGESKAELAEVGEAAKLLAKEIRDGYQHLKSLL